MKMYGKSRVNFILPFVSIVLCGCHSPVNVKPVTFDHPDEIIRNDTFVALADRRVFAVMAFINACGFDDEASGTAMHPVRRRVRQAIQKKAGEHGDLFDKWKRYYNNRSFPSYCYLDYALSLSSDYPFRRIRPSGEFGYWWPSLMLNSFPKILNEFWETVELEEIWSQVKLDYLTEIQNYDFGRMARELAFVWEYLGLDRKDRFIFISVPNLLDSHYTAIGAHYENYYYTVESPGAYSNGFNIHEYLHSFINTLMEKHYASQRKKLNAYFVAGKDMPMAKHYGQRKAYASECLVRALDHRMRLLMENNPEAVKQKENTTKRINRENVIKWITDEGLLLTEPFYRLLVEFEQSAMTFEEYLPEMLKKLPEYQRSFVPKKGISANIPENNISFLTVWHARTPIMKSNGISRFNVFKNFG